MCSLTGLINPFRWLAAYFYLNAPLLQIQFHSNHFPGRFNPQEPLIKFLLIHPSKLSIPACQSHAFLGRRDVVRLRKIGVELSGVRRLHAPARKPPQPPPESPAPRPADGCRRTACSAAQKQVTRRV